MKLAPPMRPALRYLGGKWKLAPWIISHFPPHRLYVEPFGGAASVLLRKPRSYSEVYNDLDDEVVNLFRVLRDPAQSVQLITAISLTPFARQEFTTAYEATDNPIERARRLVVRSFQGVGSSAVRRSRKTGFRCQTINTDRALPAREWANTLPESLQAVADRFRGVAIEHCDASKLIARFDTPDTLFYIDPPYVHSTRGDNHYYTHELTDDAHVALLAQLRTAKGLVVISGYEDPLYDALVDWQCERISHRADKALERTECLWINPAAEAARRNCQEVLAW